MLCTYIAVSSATDDKYHTYYVYAVYTYYRRNIQAQARRQRAKCGVGYSSEGAERTLGRC